MPQESGFKYVSVQEDDEIVIQAGCVPSQSDGQTEVSLPDSLHKASGKSDIPLTNDLDGAVPFDGMRKMIIVVAAVIIVLAVVYYRVFM